MLSELVVTQRLHLTNQNYFRARSHLTVLTCILDWIPGQPTYIKCYIQYVAVDQNVAQNFQFLSKIQSKPKKTVADTHFHQT